MGVAVTVPAIDAVSPKVVEHEFPVFPAAAETERATRGVPPFAIKLAKVIHAFPPAQTA